MSHYRYPTRRFLMVLTLSAAFARLAQASTIVRLSVEEMAEASQVVARGTCASVESHWTDDHEQILTYVTLTDVEVLKGDAAGDIVFVQLGGRVGDDIMHVVGAPSFTVGEEMVVFLTRMTSAKALIVDTDLWLIGLSQGKWSVVRDPKTDRATAKLNLSGTHEIKRPGRKFENQLPLERLKQRIQASAEIIPIAAGQKEKQPKRQGLADAKQTPGKTNAPASQKKAAQRGTNGTESNRTSNEGGR